MSLLRSIVVDYLYRAKRDVPLDELLKIPGLDVVVDTSELVQVSSRVDDLSEFLSNVVRDSRVCCSPSNFFKTLLSFVHSQLHGCRVLFQSRDSLS